MMYLVFVMLAATAAAGAGGDAGLSKGPANPSALGTRCGIVAGRDDRAYLNCPESIRQPRADPAQPRTIRGRREPIQSQPAAPPKR